MSKVEIDTSRIQKLEAKTCKQSFLNTMNIFDFGQLFKIGFVHDKSENNMKVLSTTLLSSSHYYNSCTWSEQQTKFKPSRNLKLRFNSDSCKLHFATHFIIAFHIMNMKLGEFVEAF